MILFFVLLYHPRVFHCRLLHMQPLNDFMQKQSGQDRNSGSSRLTSFHHISIQKLAIVERVQAVTL